MKRSETEHPAVAPTNVRIVKADGTEMPLTVQFVDTVVADDGLPMHEWEAISEYQPQIPQDRVLMDVLPPRTSIAITMKGPGADGG